MKVLFVNFRNNPSSALLRLSESLRIIGVDVSIFSYLSLIEQKGISSAKGLGKIIYFFLFVYDITLTRFFYKRTGRLFSYNSSFFSSVLNLIYAKFLSKFDIIHLHWVGHGFMSAKFLKKIKSKKIILTLHDYYFITGGCHIPGDCQNYNSICLNCPASPSCYDFSKNNFKAKEELYLTKKVFATAPSQTMKSKIQNSYLGSLFQDVVVVPNPIDHTVYKPLGIAKNDIPMFKNLPEDKKYILFVSNDISDSNKGFDLLLKSLLVLSNLNSICLITVGNNCSLGDEKVSFSHYHFGEIKSSIDMVTIYNLAYVTVVPSRFESFSQVTLESMACGSPVIAYDSSGPAEIISNEIDGYLIKSYSTKEFSEKLDHIIYNEDIRESFSKKSRNKVIENYSYKKIGNCMEEFYKKVLNA